MVQDVGDAAPRHLEERPVELRNGGERGGAENAAHRGALVEEAFGVEVRSAVGASGGRSAEQQRQRIGDRPGRRDVEVVEVVLDG